MKNIQIEPLEARIAPATLSIASAPPIIEGNAAGGTAIFTVTLDAAATEAVTVNYATFDGTATVADNDYTPLSGTLVFSPGETEKTIQVAITPDDRFEGDETFSVRLSEPANATISNAEGIGTIVDDDPAPVLSINDVSIVEGDDGTKEAVFTVRLTDVPRSAPVTVKYRTADMTATAGEDYVDTGEQTLTFLPGVNEQTVSVTILGDTEREAHETFKVELFDATEKVTISRADGIGTIRNDDTALSVSASPVNEGTASGGTATFRVTLDRASAEVVTVNYTTVDGTATVADSDYTPISGTLVFAPGQTERLVQVSITGDNRFEGDETFSLRLSEPARATLELSEAEVTIVDDDAAPALSIGDISVQEGDSGTKDAIFTVRITDAPRSAPVTVSYRVVPGTAAAGEDYIDPGVQTLTFLPGQTEQTIAITIVGDTVGEANETFKVQLFDQTPKVTLTRGEATGTILNDDAALSISDISMVEGTGAGLTEAVFTVTLSQAPDAPVRVQFTTEDGAGENGATAAGGDYTPVSGELVFEPGEVTKQIRVPIGRDAILEPTETFQVRLSGAENADIVKAVGIGTIVDDEPRVTVQNVSVTEGDEGEKEAVFVVTLTGAATRSITVNYATRDGSAVSTGDDADYEAASGSVTFKPGETSKEVRVKIFGDEVRELNESFFLDLTSAAAGSATGTATIVNDDAPVFHVSDVSLVEGNSGTQVMRFTITKDGETTQDASVTVRTVDGTATVAGNDYVAKTETLTFGPDVESMTFDVLVIGDTRGEADETFFVDLTAPANATVGTARATGTIVNDDAVLTIGDVRIVEGNSGTKNAEFIVTLAHASSEAVTVSYATSDGTATAGSDYDAVSGTLTFAAGETQKTILAPVHGDTLAEADQTFFVTLTNAQNAAILDGQATGTILNDDTQLRINNVQVIEGNAGTTLAIFTVTRTGGAGTSMTVDFSTSDGTAISEGDEADYIQKTGTLTFAAGETAKTIAIEIRGDLRGEIDETFFVDLSNSTNAIITGARGIGTILDNNDRPALRVQDQSIFEGDAGQTMMRFTVTLDQPTVRPVTVNYATSNGTATAGVDYTAATGQLTFGPNEQSRTIDVPIFGDTVNEPDETFFLTLSGAVNAVIGSTRATGTIVNDEIGVTIGDVTIVEGNEGKKNAGFVVTLSAASTHPVTVSFTTEDGSATVGKDYEKVTGTLTFAAGETQKTILVPVLGDAVAEGDEEFRVVLTGATNAKLLKDTGVGTITDDETATISISDVTVAEGDIGTSDAVFKVTLSNPSQHPVTVKYTTQDGTATVAGDDYEPESGTLTFAAGVTEKTISVLIVGDTNPEPDETFTIVLSDATNAVIEKGVATGTIHDERTVTISEKVREAEGNSGTKVFRFTVSLDAPAEQPISVNYSTEDLPQGAEGVRATAGVDYIAAAGTVHFAVGELTKEIEVTVIGDSEMEPDESFFVKLADASGATIAGDPGRGTIANDETVFSIVSASNPNSSIVEVVEGDPAKAGETTPATTAVFHVVRNNANFAAKVSYTTVAGSGAGGASTADFTPTNGTLDLEFAAGELSKTITIPITKDFHKEATETFTVRLSDPTNAVIGEGQDIGTVNIIDNDPLPTLSIADVNIIEGQSGTRTAVFTVTLSAANQAEMVRVNFTTRDGTAISGEEGDYLASSGTLEFAPGVISRTISITINGDLIDEGDDEQFFIDLSGAENAVIARNEAVGKILDDDATPTVGFTPESTSVSIIEGDGGSSQAVFTVKLSAPSSRPVAVAYTTVDQTAVSSGPNADFTAASGTFTFAPGETEKTITVPVHGDSIYEAHERFEVRLSDASNAQLGVATAIGTITNDDPIPTLTINNIAIVEGNEGATTAVFTVTLAGQAQAPVTVRYSTEDGTAVDGINDGRNPADHQAASGTLTFQPGETSKTIEVVVFGDLFREGDETFVVKLSDSQNATIETATGAATILDDGDTQLGILVNDVKVVEGDSGQKNATFRVELTHPSPTPISFFASTINGTASARSGDFIELVDARHTIPAGATFVNINVAVVGDTDWEAGLSETFHLQLSDLPPEVAPIAGAIGTGTIYADDMIQLDARTVQYIDPEGDIVTVKVSKGSLNLNGQFFFGNVNSVGGRQLQMLDFVNSGTLFSGTNITVTAQPQVIAGLDGVTTLGNGSVDVGFIRASLVQDEIPQFTRGIDLGVVRIDGDLGKITAGDSFTTAAIKKLDVGSLGVRGTSTGAPDTFSAVLSTIRNMVVRGDMAGSMTVIGGKFGSIGSLQIDGALIGNTTSSGQILFSGKVGKATIGEIVGGAGASSGAIIGSSTTGAKIGSLHVLGEIRGGGGESSGMITAPKIGKVTAGAITGGGGTQSGTVIAGRSLGSVLVTGDVTGGAGTNSGEVFSSGNIKRVKVGGDLIGGGNTDSGSIVGRGSVKSISIAGEIVGGAGNRSGTLQVGSTLGKLEIGTAGANPETGKGNLVGGAGVNSGQISVDGGLRSVMIHGSVQGGAGGGSGGMDLGGAVKKLAIKGNIEGGSSTGQALANTGFVAAGSIRSMAVGGDIIAGTNQGAGLATSGAIRVVGNLGKLDIGGSVLGNETHSAIISAGAQVGSTGVQNLRIEGDVRFAEILAGYTAAANAGTPRATAVNPDAQIGSVFIGGSVQAMNIVAGAIAGTDGRFGTNDDLRISSLEDRSSVISRIASVVIRGSVTSTTGDYGIVAEHVGSVRVGPAGSAVVLKSGPHNDRPGVEVAADSNFRVIELAK